MRCRHGRQRHRRRPEKCGRVVKCVYCTKGYNGIEWVDRNEAAGAERAGQGMAMGRIPARRPSVHMYSVRRPARRQPSRARSYCNNSNCYSHSTKVPSAYKSLARHHRKCFCVFLYPSHKVLPSCCLFVSKRASERAKEALAGSVCVWLIRGYSKTRHRQRVSPECHRARAKISFFPNYNGETNKNVWTPTILIP